MGPLGSDLSFPKDDDLICRNNRTELMGYDKYSLIADYICDRLIHFLLVFRIDESCCLVKDNDRRVLQKDSCKSDPLALSAGEPSSGKSRRRIISLWKSENEIFALRSFGRFPDFLV